MLRKIAITILLIRSLFAANAQFNPDSLQTNTVQSDTVNTEYLQTETVRNDTINPQIDSAFIKRQEFIRDSILAREKFVRDSILAREQFVRDSILAREKFVRDSLYKRKLILDSVSFLKKELPRLLDATLKAVNEAIVIKSKDVYIIGDSMLSDFKYSVLAQNLSSPYAPWRSKVSLSENDIRVTVDTINKVITNFKAGKKHYKFYYKHGSKVAVIQRRSSIITKKNINYYKVPVDSLVFDENNRVKLIKSYNHYFEATKNYKKGASLYFDIVKIKKLAYFSDGVLSNYQVITYCDRWSGIKANQQCHKVTYTITRQGRKFTIQERNEPKNRFSDGTFIYEFDNNFDLKKMEFKGADKTLSRTCFVELNEDRHVSRYLYKKNGIIERTLLINYNKDPNADYKYETITCYFEKDRICYFQKNNRTGKSRKRDRLTLKWTAWR